MREGYRLSAAGTALCVSLLFATYLVYFAHYVWPALADQIPGDDHCRSDVEIAKAVIALLGVVMSLLFGSILLVKRMASSRLAASARGASIATAVRAVITTLVIPHIIAFFAVEQARNETIATENPDGVTRWIIGALLGLAAAVSVALNGVDILRSIRHSPNRRRLAIGVAAAVALALLSAVHLIAQSRGFDLVPQTGSCTADVENAVRIASVAVLIAVAVGVIGALWKPRTRRRT